MKSSTGILAGSLVCLVAAGAAWWWSTVEVEPQAAPQVESPADELSEGPAPVAELEASAGGEADVTQLDDDLDEAERSELEAAQAAPTGTPASNEPQAKLRGHLRDQDTGEPLPAFLLRVHDRNHKEDLTTDAEGAFASQTAFLLGRLRVDPLDQPGRRRPAPSQQVELALDEGAPAALDLAVPCGPTYRLALQPEEAPLAGLRVNLLVRGEEVQDRVGEEPVRAGESPWVRFGPIDPKFERAERLELRSGDGVWWGDAKAAGISGVQAGVVNVNLVALASLSGKVVDDSGAAVARAQVELRPTQDGKLKRRSTSTGDDGRYRFDFVSPASYLATFKTLRHEPRELPVALAPKATQTLDAALAAKPAVGAIRGEVLTQSGRSTPKARITLSLPRGDRSLPPLEAPVVWTTVEGRKVGRFEFTSLPDGPLQLRIEHDDWFKWEPGRFDLSPPRENLRVLVYDDVATCDYVLRSRDRDNGLALERLHVWIEFEGGPSREQRVASDEPFERGVPVERRFKWRVDRAGYGYAAGDERSFQLEEHRDGRIVRVAEVDLETGWGELLRAVRRDGKGAVAGVEVLADGRSLGQTDKDGYLKVALRERPTLIEARHANWALQGQPDLRPSWRRDQRNYAALTMTPIRRPRPEAKR